MVTTPSDKLNHSEVTAKLAASFAEQGKNTLLVDANRQNPSLHQLFGIQNSKGLSDGMAEKQSTRLHARYTECENLSLLPAGSAGSAVWSSDSLKSWTEEVGDQYDVVVFHAPPILNDSDPQLLADYCDGVLLVVKENQTKREQLYAVRSLLQQAENEILGVIYQTH